MNKLGPRNVCFIGIGIIVVAFFALGVVMGPRLITSRGIPRPSISSLLSPTHAGAEGMSGWKVPSGSYDLNGWAWSQTTGWISMSSSTSGSSVDYGVQLIVPKDATSTSLNGYFIGHAWSSNLGWLRFDPPTPATSTDSNGTEQPPEHPATSTRIQNGFLLGWARFCNGVQNKDTNCVGPSRADGYDGWVEFSGSSTDAQSYGVSFAPVPSPAPNEYGFFGFSGCGDFATTKKNGCAWGSNVVGWVDFSKVQIRIPGEIQTTIDAAYPSRPGTADAPLLLCSGNLDPTSGACSIPPGADVKVFWSSKLVGATGSYTCNVTTTDQTAGKVLYSGSGAKGTEPIPSSDLTTADNYRSNIECNPDPGTFAASRADWVSFNIQQRNGTYENPAPPGPAYIER